MSASPSGTGGEGASGREFSKAWAIVPAVSFLLFTTVLRSPVTAVPPLLERIQGDLGMSNVAAGLLTSIPVLCFGAMTPFASGWLRRTGINLGALNALVLVLAGSLLRSSGTQWAAFAGTAVIGAGITLGNLVAPMVIGRDFRRRAATMTGLYSAAVNVAVWLSTLVAVPLANVVGWRGSAAFWGVIPAMAAGIVWAWVFPARSRSVRASVVRRAGLKAGDDSALRLDTPTAGRTVLRSPAAWMMAAAFCGHTFAYYAIAGWLPRILREMEGMSEAGAGAAASVFHLTGIVGPLLVPVMLGALRWPVTRVMGVVCASWLVLPVGLVALPGWWLAWCVVSGIAQGALFTALFTLIIQRSRTVDENRQTSALVQTLGYVVASLGPVVVGWLRDATGGWMLPLAAIALALSAMTVCSQWVARAR
ncbi:MAG: MFS transporter [Actinomyces sp.]|nr:MFS transporter [Actinomyces sp.]MCI1787980.1 MFS transporter [Actinomyces sp.]MCI1830529.1 MFS transporter [Actinomyces sp.]